MLEAAGDAARFVAGRSRADLNTDRMLLFALIRCIEIIGEAARQKTARPAEWPAMSSGYRLEIERMQGEILDYLAEGAPQRPAGAVA